VSEQAVIQLLHDVASGRSRPDAAVAGLQDQEVPLRAVLPGLLDSRLSVRWLVARVLGLRRELEASDPLAGAMGDSHAVVRAAACRGLAVNPTPMAPAHLSRSLLDHRVEVRVAAAMGLERLALGETCPALIRALGDAARPVRAAAESALLSAFEAGPDELIFHHLTSANVTIRRLCQQAIRGRVTQKWARAVARGADDPHVEVRLAAVRALEGATGDWVALLSHAATDANPDVRVEALRILGHQSRGGRVPPVLTHVLSDSSIRVRLAGIRALGEVCDPSTAELFNGYLYRATALERRAAYRTLARLGDSAARHLETGLFDADLAARVEAVRGSATCGGDRLLGALAWVLSRDPAPEVRVEAAGALARRRDPRALSLLRSRLRTFSVAAERDPAVRAALRAAVQALTGRHGVTRGLPVPAVPSNACLPVPSPSCVDGRTSARSPRNPLRASPLA
jgi:HEAT repeat protein